MRDLVPIRDNPQSLCYQTCDNKIKVVFLEGVRLTIREIILHMGHDSFSG
jgi:hypothetical protein